LGYLGSSYGNREHIDGSFGYNWVDGNPMVPI
jgi:hypothetical protein